MPSDETKELLDRLDRLTQAAGASEALENTRFEKAIGALDEMAGRARKETSSAFEDSVWRVLSSIPDAVVSRQPRTSRSPVQPDFLVTLADHKAIVEAKPSAQSLGSFTRQLGTVLDAYGAEKVVVVVPEGASSRDELALTDDRIAVVQTSELSGFFGALPK